jgi:hypothetical protein
MALPLFKQGKIRFYPLNARGAFHFRFMQARRNGSAGS